MTLLQNIRRKIIDRDYYLSSHAEEEMLDDGLERKDVENAILKGRVEKKMTHDSRGTRYRLEGPALDGRMVHVVCRFPESARLIIITVYALIGNSHEM
uniref:DUF4258 domain-containing protein n=1 Tax=Candidatus Kentrum eta TaxID=2126337 RepID=A0A450UZN3_9GAMM|nr:MAG: protein of unknown function (DUF4258) [Candidatus Kentron sp. H]VFK00153.1 MAG: protein of unknown function (DUF4258) [Candidatus Kentron sp. H]VFK03369.1 MAG: protein of unknown function (DUF4258) [Candidatus Kentron sp. H]